MEKIIAIVNPDSGDGNNMKYVDRLEKKLSQYFDQVDMKITNDNDDVVAYTNLACEENYDSICSFGGDGTVNLIINILKDKENPPKLAIIPGGTGNILARRLGISRNRAIAISTMDFKNTISMDIGDLGDRCFSFFLSIGAIPESIHDADSEDKKDKGMLAYLVKPKKLFGDKSIYKLRVETESETYEGEVDHMVISMSNKFGQIKFSDVDANPSDGYAHIYILENSGALKKVSTVFNILTSSVEDNENVVYMKAKSVRIENLGEEKVETDLDGDEGPELPIEIKILNKKVDMYYNPKGIIVKEENI
ncbi:MAG: diacylglycerol kinase family lipid kinase [Finegoldia sp.]|nr:diacylglycerol kinase family lipid kinase [Finegoldia sp.]